MDMTAEIGIFGGTGLYDFASGLEEVTVETPYGPPSDVLAVGEVAGRRVAFLPRHGRSHAIPPHMINYRANIWAMKELGVTRIIGPTAAGSLQPHIRPGDFVVSDQFVDRTSGRKDTFYDGPITTHVSSAEPYCPELRPHAIEAGRHVGVTVHDHGTVVVIQGPRFSTIAESKWFTSMGWEVINMTQYPECFLAKELGICYVNVALITDYDAGLVSGGEAVTHADVLTIMQQNSDNARKLILEFIKRIPQERGCDCAHVLARSRG